MQKTKGLENQQAVNDGVLTFDLGWLVCAIEGEGSISLPGFRRHDRQRRNTSIGIKPIITLSNTNEEFIDHARQIAMRYTSPGYKQSLKARKGNWTPSFRNVWEGVKRVKNLLDVIEPYLIVKRTNAALVREFCESRLQRPATTPYTERELQLFMQCRALHNRGTRDPELHKIVEERLRDFVPVELGRPILR